MHIDQEEIMLLEYFINNSRAVYTADFGTYRMR